jgi:diguanylate cyclase (GGDEF)-like protein
MVKVLLVEDSETFASLIKKSIESELHFTVDRVSTYADAVRLIRDEKSEYFVGLLDLCLPDAPNGEILDFVLSENIPPIVVTGEFSDEIRDYIWTKKVVDYLVKENLYNIDYIISLIRRIYQNTSVKVLIIEDSKYSRRQLCELLKVHQYNLLESSDGHEALKILKENPDIKLAIIDYYLPDMDGIQLTRKIRGMFSKEELAIIGISAQGHNIMSARFIKNGANDFITKPFMNEEFYCRITQNIEMIEYLDKIKVSASKDYLTDLYNRRYFFESGQLMHANSTRANITILVAMIDIDHFKKVNDTYGHKVGDQVLQHIACILKKRFRKSDIVCRFGGEEFCILTSNMNPEHILRIFDDVKKIIEQSEITIDEHAIHITVSIGICTKLKDSLEEMINEADMMLYEAKKQGRNRVICS